MLGHVVALILPLSLDTFAVSAALGLGGLTRRQRIRVSGLFAAFEGGAPIAGLLLGGPLGTKLGEAANYAAVGVLAAFGLFALLRDEGDDQVAGLAVATGRAALLLGLAVSLDEIAVGFTLGLLRAPVLPVALTIGAQAVVISQLGMRVGSRLSERVRERAEKAAGALLLVLALALLADQLL